MDYDEFVRLLNAHEWKEVEFKEAQTAVPKNAYETVSAFANTAGGHLVFGVKKDGTDFEVVGVIDVDKVQNELLSALRSTDKISQIIDVEEHLHKFGDDDLLVFYIPEAARTEKPVFLNGDIRRSFLRKGGADVKCSRDELQRLLNDASADRYDGQTVDIDLDSCFDNSTISWYRGVYESKPGNRSYADKTDLEFLFELGLIRDQKPTRAAVLLFGRDGYLRDMLPRPVADCQRFAYPHGQIPSGVRWIDRRVLDVNLVNSWRAYLEWYQKMANVPFHVDPVTLQRDDVPPDYIAFRESFVNILIHQDYADHSRKPEVRKYTDRTVFYNPGDAFDTRTDLLQPGEREVRNPRIVTAFRRIGLSEHAGWGLKDVFENWRQLGNDDPLILNDKTRKTFTITLIDRSAESDKGKTREPGDSEVTPQVPDKHPSSTPQVTPQVQRLLYGLRGEMSRTEIMEALDLKDRMYFSREYLRPSLDAGLIHMTIPDKPTSSKQKYLLTDEGRRLLEILKNQAPQQDSES